MLNSKLKCEQKLLLETLLITDDIRLSRLAIKIFTRIFAL